MTSCEPFSTYREMIAETLWGRRGIVKAAHIWLPFALMVFAADSISAPLSWSVGLLIFISAACYTQSAILANDLADRHEDNSVGKRRWICRIPLAAGIGVVALFIVIGFAAALFGKAPWAAVAAYAAATTIGVIYSLPPFQLKQRGLWGLTSYSVASVFAFVVLPWAWLQSGWLIPAVLAPAVFLDKWINLHFHQVVDLETDHRSEVKTYSVVVGAAHSKRFLRWVTRLTAVSLFITLVFAVFLQPDNRVMIGGAVVASLVVIGFYIMRVKRRQQVTQLLQELPGVYLALTFVVFRLLPLLILGRLALAEPAMWPAFGLFIVMLLVESWHSFRYRYE